MNMQRDVILWARISADGFLADEEKDVCSLRGHGMVDWEKQLQEQLKQQADTIILDRKTYDCLMKTGDLWPFDGLECFVMTEEFLDDTKQATFWPGDLTELVFLLKQQPGKEIWIAGDVSLMNQVLELELADQYWFSVCPVFLGTGIRMASPGKTNRLILKEALECDGVVTSIYYNRAE